MLVNDNVSLRQYNTFGIEVYAKRFCAITSIEILRAVLDEITDASIFILGGGSNILLTKDIDALVLHVNIKGIEVLQETDTHVVVKAMAGENWHDFVLWCISNNFGGVENLSLIPGNVGTAPIQNIGAYGVELKDIMTSCEAVHIKSKTTKIFSNKDCKFGYRDSIFKNQLKNQYIITSVNFKLSKPPHKLKLDYGTIRQELEVKGISHPDITHVSEAVIAIRQSKLPDPKKIGNSGSFFKNPIIPISQFNVLKENFPGIPSYRISDSEVKVPAAWLIEKAGFKGKRFGDYGVHNKQALVLVNYENANGKDILKLAQLIQNTILRLFGISIEMEVNIV